MHVGVTQLPQGATRYRAARAAEAVEQNGTVFLRGMALNPLGQIMGGNIINYSANDTRRVDITAGIGYSDDIDKARAAIKSVLAEVDGVLETPAPDILVSEMADSSVNFAVRPWCKPADYWDVYFGVTEGIKKKFDAEGISIPFPQRDVHIYEHKED